MNATRLTATKTTPRARGAGFTLVELLIVVSIIAILAGLLLPALARAKQEALRVQCVNNQKELIATWALYSADNREALALNGGDQSTTSSSAHLWVYGGNHGDPPTLTNSQYLVGATYALFAATQPSVPVYKCPADLSVWTAGDRGKKVPELRSYSMNSYIATPPANLMEPLSLEPGYRVYMKTSQLASDSAANRFVFMDVNPASICTPGFGVDMTMRVFIHYPSALHNRRGVVTFADSHVETHKWQDARTIISLSGTEQFIPHNIPSPNNPDLVWIGQRTTSRN
ncbi:MAG: prepilin-type N-terminal cleavage/methylation domain-containing protein [Verrucomicrobiota bacterium]|jgi:prepilin-type N-terminal cleavage/methylation domain-containing protein